MKERFTVVGIGELLWDIFPEGKRLGGAPANFRFHCQQLGVEGIPVSAVGQDQLGSQIRQELVKRGINDAYVEDVEYPTGTVQVELKGGTPKYKIIEEVAWDYLPASQRLEELARRVDAVSFGTLAQRNDISRSTIRSFLSLLPRESIRIFDVNLRQGFFSKEIIESSLHQCDVLKLSDEELPTLSALFEIDGTITTRLQFLRQEFKLALVAYTRGEKGSLLVRANESDEHPGYPVGVVDSVGAGDAFASALCVGLLNGYSLEEINEFSNLIAAHVCAQTGATPHLPKGLVSQRRFHVGRVTNGERREA